MPYFLDGNNLIGLVRATSCPSPEDRSALVSEVAAWLRRTKARAILFFDGAQERSAILGPLSIRASTAASADDAILAEIERAAAPQEIVLVTADRALSRRAHDLGAKTLEPREFWRRVGAGRSREANGSPRVDVEEWMRYFEDPRNRES